MHLLKFLHVTSAFLWISSLLMLTRLLAWQGRTTSLLLYRKTYLLFDLPFMCATVVSGLLLFFFKANVDWRAPWLHMKLTFVAVLILCDLLLLAQLVRNEREEGKVGFKILHWVSLFSLLVILGAIYLMKPNFS